MNSISFAGTIVILGCGAVSRCLQVLLLRHVAMDFSKLIIIDKEDCSFLIPLTLAAGARFIKKEIVESSLEPLLAQYLKGGDMVIDLATGIPTMTLIEWCQKHEVLFLNTALEWPTKTFRKDIFDPENTLYAQHVKLEERSKLWPTNGPTAIIEHGANPGLVSHWAKQALEDITLKMLLQGTSKKDELELALGSGNFAKLAQLSGTKVIHISERDTQITNNPKRVNEFVNTWSIVGLYEESILPAELGWGTHEQALAEQFYLPTHGPRNEAYFKRYGMDTFMYSWVPDGAIIGMLISHGEAYTISDHLTLFENHTAVYRPSVYFVYLVSDAAFASLHELRMHDYQLQPTHKIMADDIIDGTDQMGVLLLGHELNGWWMGSTLSIQETRRLVGNGHNATTLQVAASMLGAFAWMVEHPREGLCMPDDLPYQDILGIANPYLGEISSIETAWRPPVKKNLTWVFADFLVQ